MSTATPNPSVPGVTHHTAQVNGTTLHYVSAGTAGSPVLLVPGFPETWWAFHELIPLLAERHRVFAADLRGFGDSSVAESDYDSRVAAEDLHQLIGQLGVGPVHVTGQDISGGAVFRLAATHPGDVHSVTAVELGLAGFGLEGLADVTRGGSWHIGVMATPEVPELLLAGREREFLGGWRGATGLYRSMLTEGDSLKALAETNPLTMPVLAVGAGGGPFTERTMRRVTAGRVEAVQLGGVGHYAALEAPAALSNAILDFVGKVDQVYGF